MALFPFRSKPIKMAAMTQLDMTEDMNKNLLSNWFRPC